MDGTGGQNYDGGLYLDEMSDYDHQLGEGEEGSPREELELVDVSIQLGSSLDPAFLSLFSL